MFAAAGSSPPVRGSVADGSGKKQPKRFIPARAGIGCWVPAQRACSPVHPRPCGDRALGCGLASAGLGSSPPVRGSDTATAQGNDQQRFIPARAGIGVPSRLAGVLPSVHPRPCGDRRWRAFAAVHVGGSSPPVRGSGCGHTRPAPAGRFIPARAGIGASRHSSRRWKPVHPRPCGDRFSQRPRLLFVGGSSPPVRGSALEGVLHQGKRRFIPARAGIGSWAAGPRR